ncbi:cyclopropane-fatty-acyl-phospholipid synthase family protein [Pontiella agarivorans]|uniref:Cyclopropane-fatty-acyl-phospholipid synthase n=1 Tax=Pontiella agarivorans TaxID=3038953 RepID=A0ABU5MYL6_9BACT|nr:cyclopropane-fatty-acyl-phospholipid synthase family protein [Pontiella agarivorans]MDZ8119304.1 cyclopropane-fatty-acyl-phospholipid synthase [Pontiella agarivorans]
MNTLEKAPLTALEQRCFNLIDGHLKNINRGHLVIERPDGTEHHYGDRTPEKRIRVIRHRFFSRLVLGGNIGLGEAWSDGDWDSNDLTGVLELFIHNIDALKKSGLTTAIAKRVVHMVGHAKNKNTREGSRRNIHAHYDLGNAFYRLFLDPETMMYSCAIFRNPEDSLAAAQLNKMDTLIEHAAIRPEHHILEIGCGWGGFAIEAAKRTGCRVTGITLSEEQYNFARNRVHSEGLENQVNIQLQDYRDLDGQFDRIVSIEMLEAVGHAYYGTFFKTCDQLLKPNGRVVLQVITIPDQRYDAYRANPDWIQKHIFPGGMLPSLTELNKAMTRSSRFTVEQLSNIGIDYAETLRRWRYAFEDRKQELRDLGFDEAFQRKWLYYLCYCEAGFQTRFTNTLHLTLARPAEEIY